MAKPKNKKACPSCGKLIPRSARNCAFCSVRQAVAPLDTEKLAIVAAGGTLPEESESPATAASARRVEPAPPLAAPAAPAAAIVAAVAPAVAPEPSAPAAAVSPAPEVVSPAAAASTDALASAPASPPAAAVVAAVATEPASAGRGSASPAARPRSSQTGDTLIGIQVDTAALVAASLGAAADIAAPRAVETAPNESAAPTPLDAAKAHGDEEPDEEPDEEIEVEPIAVVSWAVVSRAVMALAGVVLFALYASSYKLMVAFARPQFVLQQYSLVAGLMLLAASLMNLPTRFRAGIAAAIGAVPLFLVGPSVGGFDGWRGLAAAVVFLLMPGALFLRARATDSKLARALVGISIVLMALLYLVPSSGVIPVAAALSLVGSGSIAGALTGAIFLSPLLLALLALTVFAGPDSTGFGALWACLVLLLAPGAIIAAGFADDDASLVHIGVALLAAGATAAVGLAQLLDPAPQTA